MLRRLRFGTVRAIACGGVALVAPALASSAQLLVPDVAAAHLRVRLVSEASAVAPGQKAWVGLAFALEPGWHIYWVNAGDSGQPPRVTWQAPAGYEVGPLEWPQPSRIVDSPTIVDYGFTETVLLMAPVRAPSTAQPGALAEIGADLDWLVCRDICVPGKARLSLPIRVAAQTEVDAAQHAAFEATRRRVPKPMPKTWKAAATLTGDAFVITLDTGRAEETATFFPLEELQVDNAAPQKPQSLARGIRLTVKKADELRKTPPTLKGVFVFGPGSAYTVNIPVTSTEGGT